MRYFTFLNNMEMCGKRFEKLFGIKRISSESSITQDYMDLAASVQAVLEEIIIKIVQGIKNDFLL